MENTTFNVSHLLRELRDRQQTEGILDQQGWNELVDQIIQEKQQLGEISEDINIEDLRQNLRMKWETEGKSGFETE